MASRLLQRGAFLATYLTLVLAVVLLGAIACKLHSSALNNPKRFLLMGRSRAQQQERLQGKEVGRKVQAAAVSWGLIGKAAEAVGAQVVESHREGNEGKGKRNMTVKLGRLCWPDLVGVDAEEARKKILEEHPDLVVHILEEGGLHTADYNVKRVWIYENKDHKVAVVPMIG